MRIRNFASTAVWSSLLAAMPTSGHASSSKRSGEGIGPLLPSVWTGTIRDTEMTFYGHDKGHVVAQAKRQDPSVDVRKIVTEIVRAAADNGKPDDLPDPGQPLDLWRGPGGPWDYTDGNVTYKYSCGNVATAMEYRTRKGARELRNKQNDTVVTPAGSCRRHWCHDTTAMYVCNGLDTDLVIPYYNIGWMIDRIDRLCCHDSGGKSGQMWHYRQNYSVVLGYGNCRVAAAAASTYPYLEGNNPWCDAATNILNTLPKRTVLPLP